MARFKLPGPQFISVLNICHLAICTNSAFDTSPDNTDIGETKTQSLKK